MAKTDPNMEQVVAVVRLKDRGYSNIYIAKKLEISERSVRNILLLEEQSQKKQGV